MTPFNKLSLSTFITVALFSLTACGGGSTTKSDNTDTENPEFSWANVAVSNSYSPSGDIADLTPTFSWKAVSGATEYEFGHQDTLAGTLTEYTIPAAEAACATGLVCSYKPADVILNVGEQKAWWVRGNKAAGGWQSWSAPYVFNVVDATGAGGVSSAPVITSPVAGNIVKETNPTFTWEAIQDAKNLVINYEKQDGTGLKSSTVDALSTSFTTSEVMTDGDYTWWMRAEKQDGSWTSWSNGTNFTVDTATVAIGAIPEAISPIGAITTLTPTFTWTAVANATDYTIGYHLTTDITGLTWTQKDIPASTAACTTSCSFTIEELEGLTNTAPNNAMTWFIRANINGVSGEFSQEPSLFTVN